MIPGSWYKVNVEATPKPGYFDYPAILSLSKGDAGLLTLPAQWVTTKRPRPGKIEVEIV